jgi:hypothetical protein
MSKTNGYSLKKIKITKDSTEAPHVSTSAATDALTGSAASQARQAMPWTLTASERRARFRETMRSMRVSDRLSH